MYSSQCFSPTFLNCEREVLDKMQNKAFAAVRTAIGSIRCPYHNQRESFTAGRMIQPTDSRLVRYPCGYVDGLASKLGFEPFVAVPTPDEMVDEMVKELSKRLTRLEERGVPRRTPTAPTPQPPTRKGGVAL